MTKHRAFTVIELFIGIAVMAMISSVALMSVNVAKQTAKREAERVQAYIYRVIQSADRRGQGFTLDTIFQDSEDGRRQFFIEIKWQGERDYDRSFKASNGCTYSDNFKGNELDELEYSTKKRQFFTGGTITVHGADGKYYYVIIASTEGRIRISDTPPD